MLGENPFEVLDAWFPDFIAYEQMPESHPLKRALWERATATVKYDMTADGRFEDSWDAINVLSHVAAWLISRGVVIELDIDTRETPAPGLPEELADAS